MTTPNPDVRGLLDDYAAEEERVQDGWTSGYESQPYCVDKRLDEIAPKAFVALHAVLHVHRPVDRGTGPQCAGCATHVTHTWWPCATVKAIQGALS